ncbi:helix-turn-helix domain-containing protein [Lactococcus taiwanensis]|uniref:helix-turn-helix domain-containing protein n=1 Tax=Lactococcus taiwanensis TaxID=1151742 RepID=UPI0035120A78
MAATLEFNPLRMKAERIAHGFLQEEVAKYMGVSRGKYIRIEKGETSIGSDDLALFANLVGVTDMQIFFTRNVDDLERNKAS